MKFVVIFSILVMSSWQSMETTLRRKNLC